MHRLIIISSILEQGALASKFRNMGQTCVCANRIMVQDSVYDNFAEKFRTAVLNLKGVMEK